MSTAAELKGEATDYGLETVIGRALYKGSVVPGATITVDGTFRCNTDNNGIFVFTVNRSPTARNWAIVGWAANAHVGLSGTAVFNENFVNIGDIALNKIA